MRITRSGSFGGGPGGAGDARVPGRFDNKSTHTQNIPLDFIANMYYISR